MATVQQHVCDIFGTNKDVKNVDVAVNVDGEIVFEREFDGSAKAIERLINGLEKTTTPPKPRGKKASE